MSDKGFRAFLKKKKKKKRKESFSQYKKEFDFFFFIFLCTSAAHASGQVVCIFILFLNKVNNKNKIK